jgi:F-type H+-transporting ATPase subunit delta
VSVAGTYAEALYDAAAESGAVEAVKADLAGFRTAFADSEDLARTLENPEVDTPHKRAVVTALSAGANRLVANFLQLLVDRGRIGEIGEIADAFDARVDEAEGRIAVEALTAVPLTDDLRRSIVDKVQADTGRTVALAERVDPEVLGGLVLRVGGYVVDGSLRSRLAGLQRSLTQAPVDTAAGQN